MDWNNDGRVDYKDHGIINNKLSGSGSSYGGGGGSLAMMVDASQQFLSDCSLLR